jgi:hypothetical protein
MRPADYCLHRGWWEAGQLGPKWIDADGMGRGFDGPPLTVVCDFDDARAKRLADALDPFSLFPSTRMEIPSLIPCQVNIAEPVR